MLNIDKEALLMHLPTCVFWKDMDYATLGGNIAFGKLAGISSLAKLEGLNDHNAPWSKYAELYHKHDEDAYHGLIYSQLEPMMSHDGYQVMLTEKKPLIDSNGTICGIVGTAMKVDNSLLKAFVYELDKTTTLSKGSAVVIADETYLEKRVNGAKLSKREIECLYYTLRGYTTKMIGQQLNVSYRTVQTHIEKIKVKFGCRLKSELISLAEDLGLMRFVPQHVFEGICRPSSPIFC